MDEKQYIDGLEQLVIFLANIHEATIEKALKDLHEGKSDFYMRVPKAQGFKSRMAIKGIARLKESLKNDDGITIYNIKLDDILAKMKDKYK